MKDAEYAKKFSNPCGDPISGNDGYVFTSPVGSFQANAFGLFDMHGNVLEWCQDVYDSKAYQARVGVTKDPLLLGEGSSRVSRGGSWSNTPDNRNNNLGVRVSLQLSTAMEIARTEPTIILSQVLSAKTILGQT